MPGRAISGNAGCLATALLLVLLLLAAAAPPGRASERRAVSAAFGLRASGGFRLDVESRGRRLILMVSERHPPLPTFSPSGMPRPADRGNGAASIYYANRRGGGPAQVAAELGRLGRIGVAFHPSGMVRVSEVAAPGCASPARVVRRLGTFTGTIEFEGEGGYTRVHAARARGSVGTPLPRACRDRGGARASGLLRPWPDPGSVRLEASDRAAGASFSATTTDEGSAFRAAIRERSPGGLVVTRRAYAGAPPGAFTFNRTLTAARVKPPAPFLGAARYADGSGAARRRWRGGLTVTFPGRTVALTGPGFRARLRGAR